MNMHYESNGCDLIVRCQQYGLIGTIEGNSVVGGWRMAFDNDSIGFGDKTFTSLEAAKLYATAFCFELEAIGH